jgi:glycosyltransferase involved in cell wall biosynthesis
MTDRVCIIRQRDYYELPVRREAESLRDAGFAVDVICLQQEGHPNVEEDNGVRLYRLPLNRKKGNILRYIIDYFSFFVLAGIKVTQLHLKQPYKVIQVNTMPDFLIFTTLMPRLLGAKVIVFMKEPTPELGATLYKSPLMPKILRVVEQLALKYAHMAFTVTQELKEVYVSRGANPDKIHVVLNGPDVRHLGVTNGASASVTPDPAYFTLICHGAIEERYGQDTILKAVKIARGCIPNLRLRLMGAGSYVGEVETLIRELQLEDCVEYLGWVSMSELTEELRRANVGLVAQKSSPYSNLVHTNKMYEYIIFGKPAIITRLKSIQNYFDDTSMYYFEPDNAQSLAEAILDLYQHPAKGQTLVANAKKRYELYNWNKQSEIFLNAYRSLLKV